MIHRSSLSHQERGSRRSQQSRPNRDLAWAPTRRHNSSSLHGRSGEREERLRSRRRRQCRLGTCKLYVVRSPRRPWWEIQAAVEKHGAADVYRTNEYILRMRVRWVLQERLKPSRWIFPTPALPVDLIAVVSWEARIAAAHLRTAETTTASAQPELPLTKLYPRTAAVTVGAYVY